MICIYGQAGRGKLLAVNTSLRVLAPKPGAAAIGRCNRTRSTSDVAPRLPSDASSWTSLSAPTTGYWLIAPRSTGCSGPCGIEPHLECAAIPEAAERGR